MFATQFAFVGAAAIIVVAVDQVTKSLAEHALATVPRGSAAVRLQLVRSNRAVVGRLAVPLAVRATPGILAVVALFALCAFAGPLPTISTVGLGIAAGGGIGNVADLIARGSVVDFIAVGRWPVFNVADVALWAGGVLTLAGLL
ncbi:hypothetical protein A5662_18945 [Mycobacteriaceae bacterium 1482268.1]|nr:hypothetical protein A5662_18945 [Mycobacteriaceae bacterium 1482268.1]